jgi:RNA polymerase sigma factor (sigma-70 family)
MSHPRPPALTRLLAAGDPASGESAWAELVATHSRLLLHVARSFGGEHDDVMDRYAAILEQLRRDDYHRLHAFVADGRSEFSTWLVVVAQRICLDHRRHRYGRSHSPEPDPLAEEELAARRRLVDLISAEVDLESLHSEENTDPTDAVALADTHRALESSLELLEPGDRLLIKLRFEDELPMPEIARALGLASRFHAYRRLAKVLEELRCALVRAGVRGSVS